MPSRNSNEKAIVYENAELKRKLIQLQKVQISVMVMSVSLSVLHNPINIELLTLLERSCHALLSSSDLSFMDQQYAGFFLTHYFVSTCSCLHS